MIAAAGPVLAVMMAMGAATVAALPLPPGFTALNSTAGQALLWDPATLRESFVAASIHHVTQVDIGSCFRASSAIVLNALTECGVEAFVDSRYGDNYPYFTQENIVASSCVRDACGYHRNCVGVPLDMAVNALRCVPGYNATGMHAGNGGGLATGQDLQALLEETLGERGHHVIANFIGKDAMNGLDHGGHFSPVVAFNKRVRKALVLDVSRYKYPPYWIDVDILFAGMSTLDTSSASNRGAIIISVNTVP